MRKTLLVFISLVLLLFCGCKEQEMPEIAVSDSPGSSFVQPGQPGDTEIPIQTQNPGASDRHPQFDDEPKNLDPEPDVIEVNPSIQTPDLSTDQENSISIYRLAADKAAISDVMGEVLSEEFAALPEDEAHVRMMEMYGLSADDYYWDVCYGEGRKYSGYKDVSLYLTALGEDETNSYFCLVDSFSYGVSRTLAIFCDVTENGNVQNLRVFSTLG